MKLLTTAALQIKPHFTREAKRWVTERERNEHGHVVCACCKKPIHDDQQVTINHKQQWQDIRDRLARNERFLSLDFHQQRSAIQNAYNCVGNLEPLHVACHQLVDHGIERSPEEAARLNLRLVKDKQPLAQQLSKPKSVKEIPQSFAQQLPKARSVEEVHRETPKAVSGEIDCTPLMRYVCLSASQRRIMVRAPEELRAAYLELSKTRLDGTLRDIESLSKKRWTTQRERQNLSRSWDGLVEQKMDLTSQITFLERSMINKSSSLSR